jgi:hypothetical protein
LWQKEWGGKRELTLLRFQELTGKTPEALKNKPDLPWYYDEFFQHYIRLSSSRSHTIDLLPTESGGYRREKRPNPIDIPSILKYNREIAMYPPSSFLEVMQEIDQIFLNSTEGIQDASRNKDGFGASRPATANSPNKSRQAHSVPRKTNIRRPKA